nr:Uncharacterised protein [Klebsiella pneumoniae]
MVEVFAGPGAENDQVGKTACQRRRQASLSVISNRRTLMLGLSCWSAARRDASRPQAMTRWPSAAKDFAVPAPIRSWRR